MREPASATPLSWRPVVMASAAYALLALALTWPLARVFTAGLPADLGDPLLNTWILWWNASNVPLTAAWWNAPAFFPARDVLAFSEHLLGLSPIATPVLLATGSPIAGYNVTFLLTFVLSATAMFALVAAVTGRHDAAFAAGFAFGFSPYRIAQWSHLQVLAAFWIPIALLALHRYVTTRRTRWLALLAAALVLQALANAYYLVFVPVLVALWAVWHARRLGWRGIAGIAIASALALAALAPLLLKYRDVHDRYGLTRNLELMRLYSADALSIVTSSSHLAIWSGLVPARNSETALFPGFVVLALCAAGVVQLVLGRHRRPGTVDDGERRGIRTSLGFYLFAAAVTYVLALGPSPRLWGDAVLGWAPYSLLTGLPGFESLRVPARFGMLMVCCLSVAGAIALARATASRGPGVRWIVSLCAAALMLAESWPSALPIQDPPQPSSIEAADLSGPLVVIPVLNEFNELAAMYRAMTQRQPVVNGYSGHIPPWYLTLRDALNELDPRALDALARAGVRQVSVVKRQDPDGAWRSFVATRADLIRDEADAALFALRPPEALTVYQQAVAVARVRATHHPEAAGNLIDGRPETWWYTTAPQSGAEIIELELDQPRQVAAIELTLSNAHHYPRELHVDVRVPGGDWQSAWSGPTAALALDASLRSQRVLAPMVIEIGERLAGSIRLRQTGTHHREGWSLAEIRVLANDR